MRFTSASKRDRSKSFFFPQGILEFARVASAASSRDESTALLPVKVSLWTVTVPSSLHAAATRRRASPLTRRMPRPMATAQIHNACQGRRDYHDDNQVSLGRGLQRTNLQHLLALRVLDSLVRDCEPAEDDEQNAEL